MVEISKEGEKQAEKETSKDKSAERKEAIKRRIIAWFKNPYNLALFAILVFAFAVRFFYFRFVGMQPLWMDEAEYMVQAKKWAFGFNWYWQWPVRKPVLMSFLFSMFYKIGFNELSLRFLMLVFSIFGVYLTYKVATDFFNKKTGLIAAFLSSAWWVDIFFSLRFLTEIPSAVFLLASLHFFYLGYIKKQGAKFMWLFSIFFALGFLTRVATGVMIVPFVIYILLEEKWRFILNKNLWISLLFMLLVITPFFIWLFINYPQDPLGHFIGWKYGRFLVAEHGSMGFKGIPAYIKDIPNVLQTTFFILFIFGLILILIDIFLGFDLIFKKDYLNIRFYLFALLWILFPLLQYGFSRGYVEQRDAITYSVFMFSFIGIAITKIYDFVKKYNKVFAVIVFTGLLVLGIYPQLNYGYELIKYKKDSYAPLRDAGLWIKQQANSPDDTIISVALPQVSYYSELSASGIPEKEEDMIKVLLDNNAKYFVDSTFEPYWLVPQWSLMWGQQHPEFATAKWWWLDNPEKPSAFVIVYEINRAALQQYSQNQTKT